MLFYQFVIREWRVFCVRLEWCIILFDCLTLTEPLLCPVQCIRHIHVQSHACKWKQTHSRRLADPDLLRNSRNDNYFKNSNHSILFPLLFCFSLPVKIKNLPLICHLICLQNSKTEALVMSCAVSSFRKHLDNFTVWAQILFILLKWKTPLSTHSYKMIFFFNFFICRWVWWGMADCWLKVPQMLLWSNTMQ